ncbi:MAG: response regulator [Chloroflexota bacterium]
MSVADVLIADDDPENTDMYASVLRNSDYNVRTVSDGLEALRAIEMSMPDVLIIDYQMPYLNGIEVLKGAAEKKLIPPVVIMLTGSHMQTSEQVKMIRPHVDLLLAKPYSPFLMKKIVDQFAARGRG